MFPTWVDLGWQGAVDDSNGIGLWRYRIKRNSEVLAHVTTPEFTHASVAAATTYSYTIETMDYHWNYAAAATFSVSTPQVGAIDARRVGVRPTGVYWGAMGELIDTRSGNLNFSLPLLGAVSRGMGATFALNYNLQNWRKDSAGTWKLGRDVGYGFGWKLLAGAVTPFWQDYTEMKDSNGNQILIKYLAGVQSPWADSSARIDYIEDVRSIYCCVPAVCSRENAAGRRRGWRWFSWRSGPMVVSLLWHN